MSTDLCGRFSEAIALTISFAGSALAPHDEGRTAGVLENLFGVAAKQKVLPPGVAMRRYNQEIG